MALIAVKNHLKLWRFGEYMAHYDVDYCVPRLSHEPLHAIIQIEQLLTPNTVLLGSSLGGFYATYLSQKISVTSSADQSCC